MRGAHVFSRAWQLQHSGVVIGKARAAMGKRCWSTRWRRGSLHLPFVQACLGRPRIADGVAYTVPPDGFCLLYCALAAQQPEEWANVGRDAHGFIQDKAAELRWKNKAFRLRSQIMTLMQKDGLDVSRLLLPGAAGYLGDTELPYLARLLGGSIEVVPMLDPEAGIPPFGNGPLRMRVGLSLIADGAGHETFHYVLLQSWLPVEAVSERLVEGENPGGGAVCGSAAWPQPLKRSRLGSVQSPAFALCVDDQEAADEETDCGDRT